MKNILHIQSIGDLHQILGYEKPKHPLITIVDYSKLIQVSKHYDIKIVTDFYIISMKTPAPKSIQYGRQFYDFEEGSMMFMAPQQVFAVSEESEEIQYAGFGIYFHPDLIYKTSLGEKIKEYTFFSYSVNEALHLSEDEKNILYSIIQNIQREYDSNTDTYSQDVMVASIELLLSYCQRFYSRQFITRKKSHTDILSKFEKELSSYFDKKVINGLPSVEYFANRLNLSSNYLGDLLKRETGKNTKEHIQLHIIELAKLKLLNSNDTISEIAYHLGFEYPQYFSRLFKEKTGLTPLAYRNG